MKTIAKSKWEETGNGNFILRKKDWKVSYNPDINGTAVKHPLGFINKFPMENFADGELANIETALIINNDYFILNGDWREEYEKISSKKKAISFYQSKKEKHGNPWSTQ